jgi:RNA polymerase sigma-70 factor (ECF subfamily)
VNPPEPPSTAAPPDADFASELAREAHPLRLWLAKLAGADRAEDLAQEALARAWSYRASRDAAQPLGPWLRRIAFRVHLDQRAREQKQGATRSLEEEPCAPLGREEAAAEARAELERRLAALEAHEREVLLRFHRGGESIEAIARSLGRPTGTIKSWLHRARAKLVAREGKHR